MSPAPNLALPFAPAACWRALQGRDARFDGRFFTGVRTTGIYCRPICPARTPLQRNVTFHASAAAAEAAGFRPCRRCRPEAAPGTPAWIGSGAIVPRALRLIADGALDEASVEALAERLGVGARHLRRLLIEHVGVPPLKLALMRRLHFARRLLDETSLPLQDVALASGFGSERRFRDAFHGAFHSAPSALRRERSGTRPPATLSISLAWRPPLDAQALLAFLAPRAIPGCEHVHVEGLTHATSVRFGDRAGIVTSRFDVPARCVRLSVPSELVPFLLEIVARARRLFDLDSDPAAITSRLRQDARLAPLVRLRPGLRSPGAWDPFAAAVRIIVGQQVSVAAATTVSGRIATAFGEPLDSPHPALTRLFPGPDRLAAAPLERCGLTSRRAETVRGLARALASGEKLLEPGPLESSLERLQRIPGIGPWTASVMAMRALGEPDAFPAGDLVLARALGGERRAQETAEAWRPFRSSAAMHLWTEAAS